MFPGRPLRWMVTRRTDLRERCVDRIPLIRPAHRQFRGHFVINFPSSCPSIATTPSLMGFEADGSTPDWLGERFDERTTLPRGPLEYLPIPLEGRIVRASSSIGEAFPEQWSAGVECCEEVDQVLHFWHEYLPLAGYRISATGTVRARRRWSGAMQPSSELVVFHRDHYVGTLTIQPEPSGRGTSVEVIMGDPTSPAFARFAEPAALRDLPGVQWRSLE
jgi:hypothetical protein